MQNTHIQKNEELHLERIVSTYGNEPYITSDYIRGQDSIRTWSGLRKLDYIIALVPLDVVDDINHSDRYNPRRLKPAHRDSLMDQMGTYGLIYPLVGTIEKSNGVFHLYLVDGRHRYNGLLQLDGKLKSDIYKLAEEKGQNSNSFTSYHNIQDPRNSSITAMEKYKPESEHHDNSPPFLVPVKIYLNTEEIETIGMAVFLNRGQKKLSGGEQIEKIAQAFEIALEKSDNEKNAAEQIDAADPGKVIASWIVAKIMDDESTPWFELIGRWQGERLESTESETLKLKPLTANNFLIFVRTLINENPNNNDNPDQREKEVQNLIRLGNIFSKVFDWPSDIPVSSSGEGDLEKRYTPTSIFCRSFVIQALGTVLNRVNESKDEEKILSSYLSSEKWEKLANQIIKVKKEFDNQAKYRVEFESLKKTVKEIDYKDPKRSSLITHLDELRGKLWTLDTVTSTLTERIDQAIRY
jgi:hypothetical protein